MRTYVGRQNCASLPTPSLSTQSLLRPPASVIVSLLIASMRRIALPLSTSTRKFAAGVHATLLSEANLALDPAPST